ncbi:MAG: cyclic nucleotide-binding domain-containing protein, partial [Firmicutes bacterium]|nr:cyclic nucleotide-binding domain-containing protein [Bacillota bacterium]
MDKYINVLKRTRLFSGVGEDEITAMLSCLGAKLNTYKKGEYIFRSGEYLNELMILVKGKLHIQKDDYWGNRSILGKISPGDLFGEAVAAIPHDSFYYDVAALEESAVLFLDVKRVLTTCS